MQNQCPASANSSSYAKIIILRICYSPIYVPVRIGLHKRRIRLRPQKATNTSGPKNAKKRHSETSLFEIIRIFVRITLKSVAYGYIVMINLSKHTYRLRTKSAGTYI